MIDNPNTVYISIGQFFELHNVDKSAALNVIPDFFEKNELFREVANCIESGNYSLKFKQMGQTDDGPIVWLDVILNTENIINQNIKEVVIDFEISDLVNGGNKCYQKVLYKLDKSKEKWKEDIVFVNDEFLFDVLGIEIPITASVFNKIQLRIIK